MTKVSRKRKKFLEVQHLRKAVIVFFCFFCDYASINYSGAHAPPGNRGAFARVVSPGVGQSQFLSRPGDWALAYPRATPGHLTHVFSKDG